MMMERNRLRKLNSVRARLYAHTGAHDRLSIGNDHADHLAVAGAKQKGTVAPALLVVEPGAPAGSELDV